MRPNQVCVSIANQYLTIFHWSQNKDQNRHRNGFPVLFRLMLDDLCPFIVILIHMMKRQTHSKQKNGRLIRFIIAQIACNYFSILLSNAEGVFDSSISMRTTNAPLKSTIRQMLKLAHISISMSMCPPNLFIIFGRVQLLPSLWLLLSRIERQDRQMDYGGYTHLSLY